jgi:hypothetical protein
MKDFDDLWRIIKSDVSIDSNKLKALLAERKISPQLDLEWVSFLEDSWKRHIKSYKDIPKDLTNIFNEINKWLDGL